MGEKKISSDGKIIRLLDSIPTIGSKTRFDRLYEEALAIEAEDARTSGNIRFMARALVQASLPYREPKNNPPAWGRSNGTVSLVIQPGYSMRQIKETVTGKRGSKTTTTMEPVLIGYPYGNIPRLVLAWLAGETLRTKSREIILGNSVVQFMAQLGLDSSTGGKQGSITRLREQMKRLFSATIAITRDNTNNEVRWERDGFQVADSQSFWWDPLHPTQSSLFQSRVVLSERFFNELVEHPVPVDLRALRALKQSPMALDIYCWLTYRLSFTRNRTVVPWESLQMQFGSEVAQEWKFRSLFRRALKQVLVVYPQAKVDPGHTSGFVLLPSPTSIPKISNG